MKVEQLRKDFPSLNFDGSTRQQSGAIHCRAKYDAKIDSIESLGRSRNSFTQASVGTSISSEFGLGKRSSSHRTSLSAEIIAFD